MHATKATTHNPLTTFIQIGAVALLLYTCLRITAPFISLVVWGMLIAVALYPLFLKLSGAIGDKPKRASAIFVLIGISGLIIPTLLIGSTSIDEVRTLSTEFQSGSIKISPPDDSVSTWPVVGEKVHHVWSDAAASFESTVNKFEPQLKAFGAWLLRAAAASAMSVLQFVLSVIIAGVFLVNAAAGYKLSCALATLVAGEQGKSLTDLAIETIRSVTKGVLGVAIIQAVLSAIGLVAIGVPGAGLWAGVILVLAIVQLPPLIILGPIAAWVFSTSETGPATIFLVYALVVSVSDSFLKPMFLGKGMETPMLVILIGAIGGAMAFGIVGLFIGAVVLAVTHALLMAWMALDEEPKEVAATD